MELLTLDQKDRVLTCIKHRLSPEQFETWFKPIDLEEPETGVLEVRIPNVYYQSWFEKQYQDLIIAAFQEALNRTCRLKFNVLSLPQSNGPADKETAVDDTPQPSLFGTETNGVTPARPAVACGEPRPAGREAATQPASSPHKKYPEYSLNPKFTFEYFVVGPCNRFAHAAALGVAENPAKAYNPLFIHGAVGLGKTHLLQAICHTILNRSPELKLVYLSCEGFVNAYITAVKSGGYETFRHKYRSADVLVIDDIHFLGMGEKQASQEEFFHTFNALHNAQKQIVISSDSPPRDIPTLEERLVSRFKWGLVAPLDPPSFETRVAILRNKAEANKIAVPDEIVNLIATSIDTNIRDLEGAMIKVTSLAQLTQRSIDMELTQEALKDLVGYKPLRFTINDIQEIVSRFFNVSIQELQSKKRAKSIALARQIGIYLARTLTGHSLEELGAGFGGKDHTTIMYAVEKIKKRVQKDRQFKDIINRLVDELKKKRV
jgi:chromosomal replication initiator protein